ncbi:MAG: aldehyde dehydrogenase family protein [Streptosporangiales bacterium]|nr:aldehyde dehydrogenase family protein [Streptosporangiales bacterium]
MLDLSHDPRTGDAVDGPPHSGADEVASLVRAAASAFAQVSMATPARRRGWLEAVADAVEAHADELVAVADEETALGTPRLLNELGRTVSNMRYYAAVGESGGWMHACIETVAGPPPLDLRRADLPVGPVAVFGASNFPFMFGVLGHDSCSAVAAGCPVVVKAHPAHPRLSLRLAEVARSAFASAGAPDGVFALVVGFDAGSALVDAPDIAAVAFTGSQAGGMALVERARLRPVPIPVYAEMGTVNPVVVTPAAGGRIDEIARDFVASFTLGAGQFCTKPGLMLAPAGCGAVEAIAAHTTRAPGVWLLSDGITRAYRDGVAALRAAGGRVAAEGETLDDGYAARPTLLQVTPAELIAGSRLLEECFGPVALLAEYTGTDDALAVLRRMQPSLAGSVYGAGDDDSDTPALVTQLAGQVGRVVIDGPPTGVACIDAMHHGGPWPSTSVPSATSVGARALNRFTRPVAFQNVPQAALPPALRDDNPWHLPR